MKNDQTGIETPAMAMIAHQSMAIAGWTIAPDLAIFRTHGFAGPAAFCAVMPAQFLLVAKPGLRRDAFSISAAFILLVAMRLGWPGSGLAAFAAGLLVLGLALSASGSIPLVLERLVLAARWVVDGAAKLYINRTPWRDTGSTRLPFPMSSLLLPILAASIFA